MIDDGYGKKTGGEGGWDGGVCALGAIPRFGSTPVRTQTFVFNYRRGCIFMRTVSGIRILFLSLHAEEQDLAGRAGEKYLKFSSAIFSSSLSVSGIFELFLVDWKVS